MPSIKSIGRKRRQKEGHREQKQIKSSLCESAHLAINSILGRKLEKKRGQREQKQLDQQVGL